MGHNTTLGAFSNTGYTMTVAFDFLTNSNFVGSTQGGNVAQVGLGSVAANITGSNYFGWEFVLRSSTGDFGATTPIGFRVRTQTGNTTVLTTPSGSGAAASAFANDAWYTLTATVTKTANTDEFNIAMDVSIKDGASILNQSGNSTNDLVTSSTNMFAGFGTFKTGSASNGGGIAGDNFSAVSAVPEPSAALLGALGFLALLRRKRA